MDLYRKVRLFLGGEYNHQQMIEKLIYALNHINYRSSNHFKELMKAINSYIWEKCFTEKEILSFKKDLLPNQNCKTSTYS